MPRKYLPIPDWFSFDNQGGGPAVADLVGDGGRDLIVLMVDAPAAANRGAYRVGRRLDVAGQPAGGWTPWIDVPDWFPFENQGAGLAVGDLSGTGRKDLVVFMIDAPPLQNQGYYRVGKGLDADGNVTQGWGPWIAVPDWFSFENQHGAVTLADLDGDGRLELVVLMVDNPVQQNRGVYRVGRKLDGDGNVTAGWSPWTDVPDWFPWENQAAGIAVADLQGNGKHDLLVFMVDDAAEQNQAFYKVGRDVDGDGIPAGGWSLWQGVPAWFSWENQGGGIAVTRQAGKLQLLVMMIDSPPGQNAGLYGLFPLDEDPVRDGRWELLPFHSGVLAVHAALLPTGKVLFFAGSGSSAARFASPDFVNPAKQIWTSVVWDPTQPGPGGFFHPQILFAGDHRPFDFFCGGDCYLADGRVLSAGGTVGYNPFRGRNDACTFDPTTQQWTFVASMHHGRWYPSLITLGDGRALAATGLTEAFDEPHNETLELYSPATNNWELHTFFPDFPGLPLYAHLFLMQDGRVVFDGGRMDDELPVDPCIIDLAHHPLHTVPLPGGSGLGMRNQSASVLLPPAQDQKVMVMGGGPAGKPDKTDAIDNVDVVDLKAAQPQFVPAEPLNFARLHLNAVLLPDRTVLVTGGSLKQEDQPLARLQAEIFDPATGAWTPVARSTVPRLYHSTALLLPDGRVVAAGGNPEGGTHVQWDQDPEEEMRLEVLSPPYLFRGPRPTITAAPTEWHYGQSVQVGSPQAGALRWAHLMRPCVTTHSFDTSQRLVDLPIVVQANGVAMVRVPANPNLAPPGWYMLFVVSQDGVPSVAKWAHLS
jgi:hypothetical protein